MKIEHRMNFSELARLPGDHALVPILRQKGMPVYYGVGSGRGFGIHPSNGNFGWNDNGGVRTFWWQGDEAIDESKSKSCSCGASAFVLENDKLRCSVCHNTYSIDFLKPDPVHKDIESGPDQRDISFE